MTRKRYIKLTMARGYSAREAREMARGACEAGLTYAEAYDDDMNSLYTRVYEWARKAAPVLSEMVSGWIAAAAELSAALVGASPVWQKEIDKAVAKIAAATGTDGGTEGTADDW